MLKVRSRRKHVLLSTSLWVLPWPLSVSWGMLCPHCLLSPMFPHFPFDFFFGLLVVESMFLLFAFCLFVLNLFY